MMNNTNLPTTEASSNIVAEFSDTLNKAMKANMSLTSMLNKLEGNNVVENSGDDKETEFIKTYKNVGENFFHWKQKEDGTIVGKYRDLHAGFLVKITSNKLTYKVYPIVSTFGVDMTDPRLVINKEIDNVTPREGLDAFFRRLQRSVVEYGIGFTTIWWNDTGDVIHCQPGQSAVKTSSQDELYKDLQLIVLPPIK